MLLPNLKSRYILALSIIATLSLFAFFINSKLINSQAEFSTIINISGRQRMLSQRIVKLIYSNQDEKQLEKDLIDLEKYLYLLSDLDNNLNKTISNKDEVREIFFNKENALEKKVIAFIQNVKNYKEGFISKEKIYDASNELLLYYEKLTKIYEKQARRQAQRLYQIEIIVLTITLIVLILEAFFIFKPLDKKINDNSKAMKNLIKRLEDSNIDLESFIFATSHDLKEPVRAIMNHVSYIKEELPQEISNSIHNSILRITDRVDYLYKLTDNLLDFHNAKHHQCMISSIDTENIVNQIIKLNSEEFRANNFTIQHENLGKINSDPYLLKLIFREIIHNAYQFRDVSRDSILNISYYREGSLDIFKFTDNGIGIDYEIRHKIFNPFYSSLNRNKTKVTGLGLGIVKNAIFNLKGDIYIDSNPDEGTIVLVKL